MSEDGLASHLNVVANEELAPDGDGNAKARFIRVEVSNTKPVVEAAIKRVADTFWVNNITSDFTKASFLARAQGTIDELSSGLRSAIDNSITSSTGEYVVSITAHCIVEAVYDYKALPLAEIIKEKKSGNPGFDYHHEKDGILLLFGEAKYTTAGNAYSRAFNQIVDHVAKCKDVKEVADLEHFVSDTTKRNFLAGKKGFTAAFSTRGKSFDSATLKTNIMKSKGFGKLLRHDELIVVAVDIND